MAKDEPKASGGEPITMTRSDLQDIVSTAVKAAIDGVAALSKPVSLEEQARAAKTTTPLDVKEIADVISETGARITLRITHGVVSQFARYEHPEGVELPADAEGEIVGLVPNGLPIKLPDGKYSEQYKQWKYETFWCADLNRYIGKVVDKDGRIVTAARRATKAA